MIRDFARSLPSFTSDSIVVGGRRVSSIAVLDGLPLTTDCEGEALLGLSSGVINNSLELILGNLGRTNEFRSDRTVSRRLPDRRTRSLEETVCAVVLGESNVLCSPPAGVELVEDGVVGVTGKTTLPIFIDLARSSHSQNLPFLTFHINSIDRTPRKGSVPVINEYMVAPNEKMSLAYPNGLVGQGSTISGDEYGGVPLPIPSVGRSSELYTITLEEKSASTRLRSSSSKRLEGLISQ